tara:strand:- start:10733 stop:11923 length:1191 start_codon:yes stop_codon:yes gene_type:complete
MSLITETNEQYYAGAQGFTSATGVGGESFTATFDTNLVFGSNDPLQINYALNNFKLYTAAPGAAGYTEYIAAYTVTGNTISITAALVVGTSVVVQLKKLDGGNFGNRDAFGNTVEENYGGYSYTKLNDVINNFLVAYVGAGKLIPSVKRTDVIFHAKRAIQEFSYDTLKSIKSQEITVPLNLSVIIPQDYVNYVKISCIDEAGVKKPIYPSNNLTINPYTNPVQDNRGEPIQDSFGNNIEGSSITEERWANSSSDSIDSNLNSNSDAYDILRHSGTGQRYGLSPQHAQSNGWFTMNERKGKISFSSNLADKIIVLEYISDGLSYDLDTKVPKLAEEALYAYINYAVMAIKSNQPEYVINRLKREKVAKLRNAKIRLSNIKLAEITQVMRGKSKWIK